MDSFVINGGNRLRGEVLISGAKNAALPIMAAAMLAPGKSVIHDVPHLADVTAMAELMSDLGAVVAHGDDKRLEIDVRDESSSHAAYDRVRKMRASICVLGPLLARRRKVRVAMPGGCAIGSRPIDLHLRGLRAMGAEISLDGGDIVASCKRLRGTEIFLGGPFGSTVLGTANVMMAATLAEGTTLIEHAACEPELVDLAAYLTAMGAKITGAGTPRIVVEGVEALTPAEHTVIPDRIEAGTFMVAAAITNGEVKLRNVCLDHMMAVVDKLREIGVDLECDDGGVVVSSARRLEPADVTTYPHPGFPTDLQAQLMTLLTSAHRRPWCWRAWWPRGRRPSTASTTSTAATRPSSAAWRPWAPTSIASPSERHAAEQPRIPRNARIAEVSRRRCLKLAAWRSLGAGSERDFVFAAVAAVPELRFGRARLGVEVVFEVSQRLQAHRLCRGRLGAEPVFEARRGAAKAFGVEAADPGLDRVLPSLVRRGDVLHERPGRHAQFLGHGDVGGREAAELLSLCPQGVLVVEALLLAFPAHLSALPLLHLLHPLHPC